MLRFGILKNNLESAHCSCHCSIAGVENRQFRGFLKGGLKPTLRAAWSKILTLSRVLKKTQFEQCGLKSSLRAGWSEILN